MMEKREMLLAGGFSSYERTANAGTVEPAEVSPAEPVVYWGKLLTSAGSMPCSPMKQLNTWSTHLQKFSSSEVQTFETTTEIFSPTLISFAAKPQIFAFL